MGNLLASLKSGTEQQHREIESLVDPMKNFGSLDAYKIHVLKTWIFYRQLEGGLGALQWSSVGIDFVSRQKTPLLEEDMRSLGLTYSPIEEIGQALDRTHLDFAWGCLYVLEGATLGGQVISRHLAKLGIGPENGGRFFHGYGAKTGEMWKSFQASATANCVTDAQIAEAVKGAKWTFLAFRESMLREEDLTHEP
jgi:heme oxygenase